MKPEEAHSMIPEKTVERKLLAFGNMPISPKITPATISTDVKTADTSVVKFKVQGEPWVCPHPSLQVDGIISSRFLDYSIREDNKEGIHNLQSVVLNDGLSQKKYFGQIESGKMNGVGQLYILPQRHFIVGDFKEGEADGICQVYFNDGSYFCGEMCRGQMVKGRLIQFSGEEYEGSLKNTLRHGQGCVTYPNGTIIFSKFENGEMTGRAKIISPEGIISFKEFK